jgi:hypothetical protein
MLHIYLVFELNIDQLQVYFYSKRNYMTIGIVIQLNSNIGNLIFNCVYNESVIII